MKKIVLLQSHELSIVRDIAHKTWPDTFMNILSSAQIEYMLQRMYNLEVLEKQASSGHLFYIFQENGIPLGFMAIEPYAREDGLKIHKLYVLPSAQGKGIGKKLFQHAEEQARIRSISWIFLNVNRFNKAVDFYLSLGMVRDKQEDIDIGNGYWMEDFVMVKKLKQGKSKTQCY